MKYDWPLTPDDFQETRSLTFQGNVFNVYLGPVYRFATQAARELAPVRGLPGSNVRWTFLDAHDNAWQDSDDLTCPSTKIFLTTHLMDRREWVLSRSWRIIREKVVQNLLGPFLYHGLPDAQIGKLVLERDQARKQLLRDLAPPARLVLEVVNYEESVTLGRIIAPV